MQRREPREYGFFKAAYSVKETLSLLSMGRTTLYALIKRGDLKPFKLGRKTLFCASDLAAFLDRLREGRP
jgi:excisionase family DNA binding protein